MPFFQRFSRLIVLGLGCAWMATASAAADDGPPPRNVVLFVADDHGLDAGCYGNPVIQTPHLDQLAAEGTRFENAFCTTASCSASRSVILSGLHNHANGQYGLAHADHHFSSFDRIRSLPIFLTEAGYRTARIGKHHVAPDASYKFETALAGNPGGARNGVSMAETCRAWLAQRDARPFFLYFCTADPHRGGGTIDTLPERPNAFGNEGRYEGVAEVVYSPEDVIVPPHLPDTPECRAELAQYYQSVSRVDQGLGRLVQALKETGHWDTTLLIYISDNGMPWPGAKTTQYDAGTRLPCIVRRPGEPRGAATCDALVSWVDIAPTILEYCGVDPPRRPKLHGRSLLPILDQEHPQGWDDIYGSHSFHQITMYYPMRVVRTRQYKLIWNIAHGLEFPLASDLYSSATWQGALARDLEHYGRRTMAAHRRRPAFELYDVAADPDEIDNLANDPAHANALAELQERLKAFQERTGDPWLVKWRYE